MKQQYLRLFSFLLGISFIVSGVIFIYVKEYKDEKKDKENEEIKIADEIGDIYAVFYNKEKELSSYRDELLDEMSEYFTFYTEMPSTYNEMIEKIINYSDMERRLVWLEN